MSDIVLQNNSKPVKAKGRRSSKLSVAQPETIQLEELNPKSSGSHLEESTNIEVLSGLLGRDLASLSEEENEVFRLQSQQVQEFITQASQIRNMKSAQLDKSIADLTRMVNSGNQWLRETMEEQKAHYAKLREQYTYSSVEEMLMKYTGCSTIEEWMEGEDEPGESAD